jgi:tRNA (guanine-N7-)-methyltransferase
LTAAQRRALREGAPRWLIDRDNAPRLDTPTLDRLFGRQALRILEVGFGMGEHLVAHAKQHPELDHLGVEVHRPGLGSALGLLQRAQLTNIRLLRSDVLVLLRDQLRGAPLAGTFVLFPEPWPSSPERRLIGPLFTDLLAFRMEHGAWVQLATDDASYALHIAKVFATAPGWTASVPRSRCIQTRYELRGVARGGQVHELAFRRH